MHSIPKLQKSGKKKKGARILFFALFIELAFSRFFFGKKFLRERERESKKVKLYFLPSKVPWQRISQPEKQNKNRGKILGMKSEREREREDANLKLKFN